MPGGSLGVASSTARLGSHGGGTDEQKILDNDGRSRPKGQESRKRTVQEIAAEMKGMGGSHAGQ